MSKLSSQLANKSSDIVALAQHKPELFGAAAATKSPIEAIAILAVAGDGPVKLHLGCGQQIFDGYVNIDYPQSEHSVMAVRPDVACNISDLDLPENSVDEVRLHHVFEHFNRVVAYGSLIRWHRWLKLGGRVVIETPDFEASVRDFLAAPTIELKMRAIRHLEGDQADSWAYHIGQWFPQRFRKTLETFGFSNIEIKQEQSGHNPPLLNVVTIGYKEVERSIENQFEAGAQLLRDHMVAPEEQPTWNVWRAQLEAFLEHKALPDPTISHPTGSDAK